MSKFLARAVALVVDENISRGSCQGNCDDVE